MRDEFTGFQPISTIRRTINQGFWVTVDWNLELLILITPSASLPPFSHTQSEILTIDGIELRNIIDYLTITYTISLTGLPALSLPCGWTALKLPMGIQLVGKPGGEEALLQFAYLLQENFDE